MKPSPIVKIQEKILTDFRKSAFQNAKRLLFEAEYLFNKELFQTSTFLSITSIEEMGKFYLGRIIAIKNEQNKLVKKDLKEITFHPKKQLNSFLPPFPFRKETKISKNISKFWGLVADKKLMAIRNNCLYAGLDESMVNIFSPIKEISREDSLYFLETAFEIILLQIDSLLNALDCDHNFFFVIEETKLLQEKLNQLRDKNLT